MLDRPGKFAAVAFAAATAVVLVGCGGSSSKSGATGLPGDASSTGASASAAPSGSAAPAASAAASAAAAARASAHASATTAAHAGSTPTTHAGGTAPGRPSGFTRSGGYTYDLSGTAKQPIGGTQTVSGTQSFVVDPPSGSTQHSKTSDQQGTQDMTLAASGSGLYVRDIHIKQQGFDEDFRPVGTALYFPASYHTGSQWSWRAKSTDGKYTIAVTTKVAGSGTATVGGKAQKALILDTALHITGSGVDLTDSQRDWVSTTYAIILKEHSVSHGSAFGTTFSSDVTRQLRSTTPS